MKRSPIKPTDQTGPDDAALFRAAVGPVKPLPEQHRATPQKVPRKPPLRKSATPAAIADTLSDSGTGEIQGEYLANGLSRMTLRKLKRGGWPIQDSLDLHGNNSDTARKLLQAFLHEAAQRELRCVLVIHGKGLNSESGEGVLRKLVRHWLTQHPRVLVFCDAPPRAGGSGAVLVLLKTGP